MRKFLALFAAVLLALAAVSCSSGGGDDADGTTTTVDEGGDTTDTTAGEDTPDTTEDDDTTDTTEGGGGGDADGEAFAEAFSTNLSASGDDGELVLTEEQADCVGPAWVDIVGADTLADSGVTPDEVSEDSFAFSDFGLDADQGLEMIDAFGDCDVDLYGQFSEILTEDLTDEQGDCVLDEIDEEFAREFLAEALVLSEMSDDINTQLEAISTTCELE